MRDSRESRRRRSNAAGRKGSADPAVPRRLPRRPRARRACVARYMAAVKAGGAGALLLRPEQPATSTANLKGSGRLPPEVLTHDRAADRGPQARDATRTGLRDGTDASSGIRRDHRPPDARRPRRRPGRGRPRPRLPRGRRQVPHHAGTCRSRPRAPTQRRRAPPTLRAVMNGDVKVVAQQARAPLHRAPRRRRTAASETRTAWPAAAASTAAGRDHNLTVELDGYQFHNSRHSWEQDRQREREARQRGDEFRRYTYADVFEDPALRCCAELGRATRRALRPRRRSAPAPARARCTGRARRRPASP